MFVRITVTFADSPGRSVARSVRAVNARLGREVSPETKIVVSADGAGDGFVDSRTPWIRYERNGIAGRPESVICVQANPKTRASPGRSVKLVSIGPQKTFPR